VARGLGAGRWDEAASSGSAEGRAARILAEAWADGAAVPPLGDLAPASIEAGERLGRAAMAELGLASQGIRLVDGRKGPLIAARVLPSGAGVPLLTLPHAEIRAGLLLGFPRGVAAGAAPASVGRAIGWVAPAIDLAVNRWSEASWDPAHRAADLEGHALVVRGDSCASPGAASLRRVQLALGTGRAPRLDRTEPFDAWQYVLNLVSPNGLEADALLLIAAPAAPHEARGPATLRVASSIGAQAMVRLV